MALDKKASMYSSAYGSAEELDAYGVWVKSEPQDLASSLAGAVGMDFGGGAMPFEADYDTGYDGMGIGAALSDIDGAASHLGLGMGDYEVTGYDDGMPADEDQGEGMSTQILAKIADELTTIRSELTTIKKELEVGRSEAEEDGDGMDTILASSDFSSEEEFSFDSQREADAARLRKLSEQNEASTASAAGDDVQDGEGEEEIIDIDLENLGIDLDAEIEKIQLEAKDSSEDAVDLEREVPLQLAEELSSFDPLDEVDEMRNLRLEGARHLSPVPDDAGYLEEYPFSVENTEFEDLSPIEDSVPDLSFDDASFSLDEFPIDSPVDLEDEFSSDSQFAPLDLSGVVLEEPDFSIGLNEPELAVPDLDEPELISLEEPLLEGISLETKQFETSIDLGIQDDSLAQIIPEGFELEQQEEAAAPFDEDLEAIVEEDAVQSEDNAVAAKAVADGGADISPELKSELKNVLTYMDHLLESLPEEKIEEFAQSEHFDAYKKIFKELGLT